MTKWRPLSSGGSGDVFVGRRTHGGKQIVRKYLREWRLPHSRQGFERQLRVLRRRIPGLVPVLAWNLAAQPPYYEMPYLEGGALTQHAGRLDAHQMHNVAMELARVLANLHAFNEVDGDFKPDNIFVGQNGHLTVGDPLGNGTILTILFGHNRGGTPGYWAPEIAQGGSISWAGDSFSYGATLYHLLTGRRPVDGQRLDPASEGYASAPRVCEVIRACCQTDPDARPTMKEVLRLLNGEQWSNVKTERLHREMFVGGLCFIGAILFLAATFNGRGRRA